MNLISLKPTVVLVGKTNVGKSSIFNCLSDKKFSIAHKTPGATRDFIIKDADFLGNQIQLVDSGGLKQSEILGGNPFQELISTRVESFIKEKANLVVFIISAKDLITYQDEEIAKMLRKISKRVLLVVNKVDDESHKLKLSNTMIRGFSEPVFVSAAQKKGLYDLRLNVLKCLDIEPIEHSSEEDVEDDDLEQNQEEEIITNDNVNVAIVGRPNSGKSTFINAILNEDRVMTSEIAGTTVDAVDTYLSYNQKEIVLVDTAGIRRQKSISEELEKMAIARTLCAIDRASVSVLMISAIDGVTEQDKKIAGLIFEKKKAVIIAVNKWDEDILKDKTQDSFISDIKFHLAFLSFAPIMFLSAKYGKHIFYVLDLSIKISARFCRKINTSKLNRSLEKALAAKEPAVFMGQRIKMYFAVQTDIRPPTFSITCSKPEGLHFSYKRYLMNFFRKDLNLNDIPIRLLFKKKSGKQKDNYEDNRCNQ
jgi:GTP-binding protein